MSHDTNYSLSTLREMEYFQFYDDDLHFDNLRDLGICNSRKGSRRTWVKFLSHLQYGSERVYVCECRGFLLLCRYDDRVIRHTPSALWEGD